MVVFRKEASDKQMSILLSNILKKRSLHAGCLKQYRSKPTWHSATNLKGVLFCLFASQRKIHQKLIESLGLSNIVSLCQELKCWEELLINFDNGASLSGLEDIEIGAGKTTHLEQGLDEDDDENTDGDGMVPEDPLSFPLEHPSGSHTVCFS